MSTNGPVEPINAVYLNVENEMVGYVMLYAEKDSRFLARHLYGEQLTGYSKQNEDLVRIGNVHIFQEAYETKYLYSYGGLNDAPETLRLLNTTMYYKSFIAWDINATSEKARHDLLPCTPREISRLSVLNTNKNRKNIKDKFYNGVSSVRQYSSLDLIIGLQQFAEYTTTGGLTKCDDGIVHNSKSTNRNSKPNVESKRRCIR